MTNDSKNKEKIRFSKAFWVANTVELFERAAYYGVFIVITLYLSRILGFNDIFRLPPSQVLSPLSFICQLLPELWPTRSASELLCSWLSTLLTIGYGGLALFLPGLKVPDW